MERLNQTLNVCQRSEVINLRKRSNPAASSSPSVSCESSQQSHNESVMWLSVCIKLQQYIICCSDSEWSVPLCSSQQIEIRFQCFQRLGAARFTAASPSLSLCVLWVWVCYNTHLGTQHVRFHQIYKVNHLSIHQYFSQYSTVRRNFKINAPTLSELHFWCPDMTVAVAFLS